MAVVQRPSATVEPRIVANGAALASFLGAGIGAFAIGFFVILSELGVFRAPTLYAPAGGLSGRTTFAAVVWLIAWGLLHSRWKGRQIDPRKVFAITLVLIGLGIVATFPPVWALL
jgi:multisubunit Na+/H+ antiporter MnhG subunit